jgi:hypothetical protein
MAMQICSRIRDHIALVLEDELWEMIELSGVRSIWFSVFKIYDLKKYPCENA